MKGGGGSDFDDVIMLIYQLYLGGFVKMTNDDRRVKITKNLLTSYVNDPFHIKIWPKFRHCFDNGNFKAW